MKQTKPTYKAQENCRFLDSEKNLTKTSRFGNPLERLIKVWLRTLPHDSQSTKLLIDESDAGQELYADNTYIGKEVRKIKRKYSLKDRMIKHNARRERLSKRQYQSTGRTSKPATSCACFRLYGTVTSRNLQLDNRIAPKCCSNLLNESGLQCEPSRTNSKN